MEGLGINLGGLITQIVGFLVLFGILYAVLYKPVLRMMDQRSARIKESLDTAEQGRQEAASSQEEMEKRMEEARAEGQTLITRAREMAERYREEEMTRARNEIRAERDRAQADIQRERDSAVEELRREFTGLAISAAERVIQRSLDTEAHRGIIEQVLEESSDSSRR